LIIYENIPSVGNDESAAFLSGGRLGDSSPQQKVIVIYFSTADVNEQSGFNDSPFRDRPKSVQQINFNIIYLFIVQAIALAQFI
jgi:hypothetical protein